MNGTSGQALTMADVTVTDEADDGHGYLTVRRARDTWLLAVLGPGAESPGGCSVTLYWPLPTRPLGKFGDQDEALAAVLAAQDDNATDNETGN